jgi:prophage regulatory protein
MRELPETGFLRLPDIIGEEEVTQEQAEANREYNKRKEQEAIVAGRVDKNGSAVFARRPTTPRPATPALIPVKRTSWWAGVKAGRFPAPVKLGPRVTCWRVSDIRSLIEQA